MPRPSVITVTILVLLALAIILPRVSDLGAFKTADEKMWIANTTGFTANLALGKWDKLLQQPHPGITTQWLGTPTINSRTLATQKLPLALGQSVIVALIGYIFYRLWGKWPAITLTALLALNPFLIAHTRVYAMDSLLALFSLLSIGCLLLWHKSNSTRYLAFAAVAASLAVLSKLPGVIIIPFSLALIVWWSWPQPNLKSIAKHLAIWITVFILTTIAVFPSVLLNYNEVKHLTYEFLVDGDAQNVHHAGTSYGYYVRSLVFFSTPLHFPAIATIIISLWLSRAKDAIKPFNRQQIIILALFALLFVLQMTLGAKKGDRYILPSFVFLDAIVVLAFFSLARLFHHRRRLLFTIYLLLVTGIAWQAFDVARLHPHALSYVNPITKHFFADRRLGWGEGYDLAATYLNSKPNSSDLKVAAQFPAEFSYNFPGEVIPLNHLDGSNVDYVVLYRALLERGDDAWETDVLNKFAQQVPDKIISLNGLEYIWIFGP